MNLNDLKEETPIIKEISRIYSSTFSLVGIEFIDSLLKQVTIETKVSTALLLQVLSKEEYKDILDIYKDEKKFHVVPTVSNSNSPEYSISLIDEAPTNNSIDDKYLFIRSCYSTQPNDLLNTIIPISCLKPNSPYLKTLLSDNISIFSNIEHDEVEKGIYPNYQHFIGLNLNHHGILCCLDNEMENIKLNIVSNILNIVKLRCINELEQLKKQEALLISRNIAIIDAENKLKFLADMSHEIRTPMNAVIALTDLLLQERTSLNIEQIEHLEVIQTSGNHLLTIINDILDISKLNHDPKFKLECRRFSLRKCLKDTLNMARHQASMSQQNKVVFVLECPQDKDDNVPLPQLISQLENKGVLLRPLMNKKGKTVIPLIWKIDSDVPDHLLGDAMRLTQIMLNLCSNAIKFTKQGGIHIRIKRSTPTPLRVTTRQSDKRMTIKEKYDAKIETIWSQALQDEKKRTAAVYNPNLSPSGGGLVSTEETENSDYLGEKAILEISVTDTGIGIPADRLPKLFKSFSQIDISTARRYGGTGLGLAISSTLVNRMGGCVWVESEEGVGSRFALTLPMTVAPRTRNYSSDSTLLGLNGSPSSPSSTVSDSSSSVHSTNLNNNDLISPMYTFTSPTVNNNPNNPGYFPITSTSNLIQQQQQRPMLSRATNQNVDQQQLQLLSEPVNNSTTNESFTPMAEDTQILNQFSPPKPSIIADEEMKKPTEGGGGGSSSSSSNIRKSYDLLSPISRNRNVGISKQHYHNRKPQPNKEENLAKLYPLRILLAEDNILNQKIAISILKRLGYIDVAIANNGREVLNLMKTSVYDVIFMDLYMPEMDGLEVTREIIKYRDKQKSNDEESSLLNTIDVYIIALTASASREDRQICIDAGMNDFISKPFTMTEMKSALKTCANKRKKRRKVVKSEVIEDSTTHHSTDDPMLDIQPSNN